MIRDRVIAYSRAYRRARRNVISRARDSYSCCPCCTATGQGYTRYAVAVDYWACADRELRACEGDRGAISLALVVGCDIQRLRVDGEMPNMIRDAVIAQPGAYRRARRDVIRRPTHRRCRRRTSTGQGYTGHAVTVL